MAAAQGVAAVGTVVLLIALLPSMGVVAAAIASTISYGVALAAMIRWLLHPPRTRRDWISRSAARSRHQPRHRARHQPAAAGLPTPRGNDDNQRA